MDNTMQLEQVKKEMAQSTPLVLTGETAIETAVIIANKIQKIIKDFNLSVEIKKNHYVMVEGWNMVGTMIGFTPHVLSNTREERDGFYLYKCSVQLRDKDGFPKSDAIAIACSNEMKGRELAFWTSNEFSVASMAQTRAIGKAYRLGLSWVIKMAGYAPTPYEEMNVVSDEPYIETPVKVVQYSKAELKNIAIQRLTEAFTSPEKTKETIEKIKNSGRFTAEELNDIIDNVRADTEIKQSVFEPKNTLTMSDIKDIK